MTCDMTVATIRRRKCGAPWLACQSHLCWKRSTESGAAKGFSPPVNGASGSALRSARMASPTSSLSQFSRRIARVAGSMMRTGLPIALAYCTTWPVPPLPRASLPSQ